ncbi:GntR family transcriptional regulator [Mycobacterium sp. 236(2023)]|uniref:FadR/GntR family transcriptional regulator n=1 Tax=Mycobacterium sp. 236(2023) TaxID=3038163 RepID=UPI002415727B|nr:GntR family transcriptional regulator [Mycobacterium sp. 236(2023)]MDG4667916.1 GntR family transcriptional regulator [Mycobacterium sp. 236(2023)]
MAKTVRIPRETQAAGGATPSREKPKQVADELRRDILDGELAEGESLGTEAELVERFGVSRPTLREALRILEAEGLISILRGVLGGVAVHRPDRRMTAKAAALVLRARSVDLADVFEASTIIEPAAARAVAASRGRGRVAKQLRDIIAQEKREVGDAVGFTNAQVAFHEAIVDAAGNRTLTLVSEMLNEVIGRAIEDVLTQSRLQDVNARRSAIRAHEGLVQLIEAGEGDAAQAHWNTHMARLRRSLLGERGSAVVELTPHL